MAVPIGRIKGRPPEITGLISRGGTLSKRGSRHEKPTIDSIVARVVDRHAPFKAFDVYHPLQNGSTSIKAVLPALTGTGYEGMAIADGGTASQSFLRIAPWSPGAAPWSPGALAPGTADVAKVRADREAYCRLDTLAMVRILDAMQLMASQSEREP